MSAKSFVRAAVWTVACHASEVPGLSVSREIVARTIYGILEVESAEWWVNGAWKPMALHIQGKCGEIGLPQLTYAMFVDAYEAWENSAERAPHLMPRMDTLEGQLLAMPWYWSRYLPQAYDDADIGTSEASSSISYCLMAAIHHCGPGGVGPDRERYVNLFVSTLKKQGVEVFNGERPEETS